MKTTNKMIKICQIGAGLIGQKRIMALINLINAGKNINICAVYDPYLKEKPELLKKYNLHLVDSLEEIFSQKPDWIFISTPHDVAVELTKEALSRGYNVLVEKPLGRNLVETKSIVEAQIRAGQLFIGYNYRFYDGVNMAIKDMRDKVFGNIISVNMILGHGGNPKDINSWKLDPKKAGGGVLIDPGIHMLDLCKCMFTDNIESIKVLTWQGSWDTGIEEEAHVLMQSGRSIINLQLSIVKWHSTFKIEINGDKGYGIVSGRGGSYGLQRYIRGKKWGWLAGQSQKETETLIVETDGNDVFQKEITALLFGDSKNYIEPCNADEALDSMQLLDSCRKQAGIHL